MKAEEFFKIVHIGDRVVLRDDLVKGQTYGNAEFMGSPAAGSTIDVDRLDGTLGIFKSFNFIYDYDPEMVSYVISTGKGVEGEKKLSAETSKPEKHSFKVGDLVTSIQTDVDMKMDDNIFLKSMVFSKPKKIVYLLTNGHYAVEGMPYIYTTDMLVPAKEDIKVSTKSILDKMRLERILTQIQSLEKEVKSLIDRN